MFADFDLYGFVTRMVVVIICLTIHEYSHAMAATLAGDETPKRQGRLSFNPIDHLDPMGTIMMVVSSLAGVGFGWAKPVMTNPFNYNHPRWDPLKVALWGPLSNIVTAVVVGLFLRFSAPILSQTIEDFLFLVAFTSVGLAFFNLIPVGPLDGSHILEALLPRRQSIAYAEFMSRNGMFVLILLLLMGPSLLRVLVWLPAVNLVHLLVGI
jgi:Zn-dependent protease